MGLVIEISGYKAVGKSTLISKLRNRYPSAIFREGFRKIKNGCNLDDIDEFIENQRIYIEREIKEFKEFEASNKLVFLLKGPEEVAFFTRKYPLLKFGETWSIDEKLNNELHELDLCKANKIIWLEADDSVLNERKTGDLTKPRSNMEKWCKIWKPALGNYLKAISYCDVIDTNNLDSDAVLNEVINKVNCLIRENVGIPERLYIETTNACNARCIMCPHPRMKRKIEHMDDSTFNLVLNNLKNIDLKNTTVFMHKEGEPFLDPKIIERIKLIRENTNASEIAINSNGSLLNSLLVDKLLKSGIDTIYLSVDGASKSTYEAIRLGLDYDVTTRNIEYLLNQIKIKNLPVKVIMQMLVNDSNYDESVIFRDKWSKFPCEIFIKKMHSYLDGGNSSLTQQLSSKQLSACTDPFNMLVIYSNGNYGCCCWDYENEIYLGNIKDETVLEAFNGYKINGLRELHSNFLCKKFSPCNRCMRAFGCDEICGVSGDKEIEIK